MSGPNIQTEPGYGYTQTERKLSTERKQIKAMKPQYEAIINWLIDNPTAPVRDGAEYFGVTPTWFRIIINSDAFRARLSERQDEVFHTCVADLREKTHAAAHEALDRFMGKISSIEDPMKLLKAVDSLFEKLGYSSRANAGSPVHYHQQNNTTLVVGADALSEARSIMNKALTLKEPHYSTLPKPPAEISGPDKIPGPDGPREQSENEPNPSPPPEDAQHPRAFTSADGD